MTPEQRVSEATSAATYLAYRAGITVAAAKALYAALATNPTVQDAVLAALVEGGRLVEEDELAPCPSRHYERDLFGEWCDEPCRSFAGHDNDHECVSGQTWPRTDKDPKRRVMYVEPEWREATP